MKTTRHSLLAKGLMVLLSLLILIFAFTYSWYTDTPKVEASGITASIESAGDFEYAIGFYNNGTGGDYKVTPFSSQNEHLDLESIKVYDGTATNNNGSDSGGYFHNYNLLHDFKPIDVTGDGATLIRPAMAYGNSQIDTSSLDYSVAQPNVQYISFDLYFRSASQDVSIALGNGSWVKAGCEKNSFTSLIGTSTDAGFNKSTYGDFSKDAIAGAVRIAFVPYDYDDDPEGKNNIPSTLAEYQSNTPDYLHSSAAFIWIPRPDIYLARNQSGLTGWTLQQAANTSTAQGPSTDPSNVHKYYNIFKCQPAKTDGYVSGSPSYHISEQYSGITVTPASLSVANQNISTISSTIHIGDYYYTKVNVRIWIEGTDAESRRATSGGKFEVNFKFVAGATGS